MTQSFVTCAAIVGICYAIAFSCKQTEKIKDNYIPIISVVSGSILAMIGYYIGMASIPAEDPITALWVGAASGLSAVGINQLGKQLTKDDSKEDGDLV